MSPIAVRSSPGRGRGVFATRVFQEGDLIETCPVIVVPEGEIEDDTALDPYTFRWTATTVAIVLGLGGLYNHSYRPNAIYRRRVEAREMEFIAHRDIHAGEEIFVNYNGDPLDQAPLDFPVQ